MADNRKSGAKGREGGYKGRGESPSGFRDGQPVYHSPRGPKGGGNPRYDGPKKDGYAPRYDGPKKDGYAPRYDGPKKDGYAPRYDGPKKDGYAPRYDGPKKDGYAPRYDGPKKDGYAPRYDGPKKDGYAPRYDKGGKYQDKKPYPADNKPTYRKSDARPADAQYPRGERKDGRPGQPERERGKKPLPVAPETRSEGVKDELPYLVMGRNAVREAVKSGRSIDRILVSKEPDGSLREIVNLARDRNLRVDEVEKAKLDELCMPFGHGGKTGNHQGIVAQVPGVEYCEISDMLNAAKEKNEKPFIILLDGIEDPHNLGSIIRSAVCAGAHGVILPKRRSASVTAAACKASAGATEYCKVARVSNLAGAIERLKDERLWIAGADMGGKPMGEARMEGALALVIGGEGEGLSRLVREKCDFLVSIPMQGPLGSLNASVAAAVLMFEKRRQDGH